MSLGISDYLSLNADIKLKEKHQKNCLVNEIKPIKYWNNNVLVFHFFRFLYLYFSISYSIIQKNINI